jgi:hypothetical protein
MATQVQVVIDCADPERLAEFWAQALHYKVQPPPTGFESWEEFLRARGVPQEEWNRASAIVDPDGKGPRIYFQSVPEGKVVKNRLHLDLNVSRAIADADEEQKHQLVEDEVRRLQDLGAHEIYRQIDAQLGDYWVTMADIEGNEFCVQ